MKNIIDNYEVKIGQRRINILTDVNIEHDIKLTDNIPINQPPRRLPYSLQQPIKNEIEKLLSNDFIERSNSLYASPIVPIIKKNGKVKIAVDYRQLNKKTVPRTYPIPHPDDLFNKVKGAKYFSVLDLQNGYFHIPIKESDRHKTAFILPWDNFQWKRLALGLLGEPFTFSNAMHDIFADLPFVVVYFDDLMIYSTSIDEHLNHLEIIFERLLKYGLRINTDKSQLCLTEVTFLGFDVNSNGLKINATKISEVATFHTPQNQQQLRSFLGVTGFLRKFIPNFSIVASPLYDLLKKGHKFIWSDVCDQAFNKIKNLVSTAETLALPDFSKPFALYCDAADHGIGYFLSQEVDNIMKPICYGGRTLNQSERKYAPIDKELLAVFFSVKKCNIYLYGHHYIVYTDHQPLTFLSTFKDVINKRYRWILFLEELGVKIIYVQGKDNILADFVSRNVKDTPPWRVISSYSVEFNNLSYSDDEIREAQREDIELAEIIHIRTNNTKKRLPVHYRRFQCKLIIENDILYYNHHGNKLIVAPSKFRNEIIELCHSNYLSGHFGIFKSHKAVLNRFWWPKLFSEIETFISECRLCQRTKHLRRKEGFMCIKPWPNKPIEFISIDYQVDLPTTPRGKKHILVVNDHFSKFIKLYAVKDRTAPTAASCMTNYVLQFGIPDKLLSDQDPSYESNLFQCLMNNLGIKKLRTSGYRPNTNGLTEQSNTTIKNYLTAFLESSPDKTNWDLLLDLLAYAYNSSVHTSTGYSPAELFFGRKFKIPIDILYGSHNFSAHFTIEQFSKNLNQMYELARNKMNMRQATAKTYYDRKRIEGTQIKPDDLVLVYNPRLKGLKLHPKWEGPCKVCQVSDHVLEIELKSNNQVIRKWLPRDRLKLVPKTSQPCDLLQENIDIHIPSSYDSSDSDDDDKSNRKQYNMRVRHNRPNYKV